MKENIVLQELFARELVESFSHDTIEKLKRIRDSYPRESDFYIHLNRAISYGEHVTAIIYYQYKQKERIYFVVKNTKDYYVNSVNDYFISIYKKLTGINCITISLIKNEIITRFKDLETTHIQLIYTDGETFGIRENDPRDELEQMEYAD